MLFSCKGAAPEVLMCVCPSVCLQVEIFKFMKVPEGSGKVQGRFREGSGKVQGRFREGSGKVEGRFRDGIVKVQ